MAELLEISITVVTDMEAIITFEQEIMDNTQVRLQIAFTQSPLGNEYRGHFSGLRK